LSTSLLSNYAHKIVFLNRSMADAFASNFGAAVAQWGAAVAQWGKRAVLQPQGCGFDPRSPH